MLRAALALSLLALAVVPARADTCASRAITVRGEVSHFAWSARLKARGNWRARVRAMPGLGDPFANWTRASDATERCITGPDGTSCILSGTPCRK
jgi:hypothetical protein